MTNSRQRGPDSNRMIAVLSALAQETRLEAYRLLLRYYPFGLAAGDISRLLAVPHNTLSTHLGALQTAGLVRSRKQGRSIIFAAQPTCFAEVGHELTASGGHLAAEPEPYPVLRPEDKKRNRVYNVLVLCRGNSARSIIAEAILNREGKGRFRAFSAGSHPQAAPSPITLDLLGSLGYDISDLSSKSWVAFSRPDAPVMDFVITVCDRAAGEACPTWPGHPLTVHWGVPSIADLGCTEAQQKLAYADTYRRLMSRITTFVNLAIDDLALPDLKSALRNIGAMEGATDLALHAQEPTRA
jgi:protein-tyrosine-phosphatase